MGLFDSITKGINNESGSSFDLGSKSVQNALKAALPIILYGMYKNSKNAERKDGLEKAINDHSNDDVSNINDYMNNLDSEDSKKMVDHVFRGKTDTVAGNIARQAGVSQEEVNAVLEKLTPTVISMLAKEKGKRPIDEQLENEIQDLEQKQSGNSFDDLLGGLGGILGGAGKSTQNSNPTKDILSGGLRDILGGFFK